MVKLYKVKDSTDSFNAKRSQVFDVPHRIALVGASGSGKTSLLVNLYANVYDKDFKGEDIFIISGSINEDEKIQKLISYKETPETNLVNGWSASAVEVIYDFIRDEFRKERQENKRVPNRLIIFDDISFSGGLSSRKRFSIIDQIVCNCRKMNVSLCFTAQHYTQLSSTIRSNLTGACFFTQSNSQLDLIDKDFNYTKDKQVFKREFRDSTDEPFEFFVVDKSNPRKKWYSQSFTTIIPM